MDTEGLVSDDAGNVNINREDSKPDEVTHGCTEKKGNITTLQFVV